MTPSVGRIVHYVSYGTPGGEYQSACRAAVITQTLDEPTCVGLAVINPTGLFFHEHVCYADPAEHRGGFWHWPERIE